GGQRAACAAALREGVDRIYAPLEQCLADGTFADVSHVHGDCSITLSSSRFGNVDVAFDRVQTADQGSTAARCGRVNPDRDDHAWYQIRCTDRADRGHCGHADAVAAFDDPRRPG